MKHGKKLLGILLALAMVLSLGTGALASGSPSGELPAAAAAGNAAPILRDQQVLAAKTEYPNGVIIGNAGGYTAPAGYFVVMTVNGAVTAQAPGYYAGPVVFDLLPLSLSNDGSSDFQTQSLILKNGQTMTAAGSALNGTITPDGISGAYVTADGPNLSVVTVVNGQYRISDSAFHILQTGDHASGGNDFTGDGCAIAVTGGSKVYVENAAVTGDGVTRNALYGGLSTHDNYPTIYVSNSTLTSTGDPLGEDCAVWVLGLHGVVRTCQFCDYYDNYFYNTAINSFGWACLSVDGTEAPTAEDLTELNAHYVDGYGYFNADGTPMALNQFAVAATGLTDDYLARLAAVQSTADMEALPQTNDTSLYYFSGKNTLIGCDLAITGMDEGRTGYSSYSIGANINVYSGCTVTADYGNVEANEYASSAYVNGTTVNARKSIVMCHSNAGGITFVDKADLTAGEIAFVYKGTGDGYTQENLDTNASTDMIMGATGSNLYVRNSLIKAPVLLLAFDSDDPGMLGGQSFEIDDSIAPKDTTFDVTQANNWGPASTMWASASYSYNEAVQAYFEDCTGPTALVGDIYNGHQFVSKNLVLTLDNSQLTGVISSGYVQHDVDVIDRTMASTDADYVGADGLRHGNRENLGAVDCFAAETVNNGVILTLTNGAVWNVTGTSYVSVLNVDATSAVIGTVTVLPSGIIRVDPAAGAAAASSAEPAAVTAPAASAEAAATAPVAETAPAAATTTTDTAAAGDTPAGFNESMNAGLNAGAYPHFDEFRDYTAAYALADSFMANQPGIPGDIYAAASPYIAPFCDINPVIGAMDYASWMAANYPGEAFPAA